MYAIYYLCNVITIAVTVENYLTATVWYVSKIKILNIKTHDKLTEDFVFEKESDLIMLNIKSHRSGKY